MGLVHESIIQHSSLLDGMIFVWGEWVGMVVPDPRQVWTCMHKKQAGSCFFR